MNNENRTFKKITNNDIYNLMLEQGKEIARNKTRSIVNFWLGSTALSISIGILIGGILL